MMSVSIPIMWVSFKEKCPGEEKYNTCYGEGTEFSI